MTFLITARDASMTEIGDVKGYLDLDLELRNMAVGGAVGVGTVVVSTTNPALKKLLTDDGDIIERTGLVIRRAGSDEVVASGNLEPSEIEAWPGGRTSLMVKWDDAILGKSLAYADPTTDISSTGLTTLADGHDIRTGLAEDVFLEYVAANIGPSAGIVRRQYPWLILPTSLERGGSDTWKARDETLLDLGRRILIPHGLQFRLAQNPAGAGVLVSITEPSTEPTARFSAEAKTLRNPKFRVSPRTVDEVIVAGPGTEAARVRTRRNASVPAGELRSETFIDARQASGSGTEIRDLMRQPADEALADGAATGAASFELVEQSGCRYGIDWRLGDTISVADWRRTTVTAVVQSVHIKHSAGRDPVITPFIGSASDLGSITALNDVRRLIRPLLTE